MEKLKERRVNFRGAAGEFGLSSGESSGIDQSQARKSYEANGLRNLVNLCDTPR